jgi:curved DNA-binding protein CbpA
MTGSQDPLPMNDPFAVLDLPEDADDQAIQKRYLALVRRHSPERAPERFAELRAAYERIRDRRDRLRLRLLGIQGGALMRLKRACLDAADPPRRPGRSTVNALLRDGAERIWADSVLGTEQVSITRP